MNENDKFLKKYSDGASYSKNTGGFIRKDYQSS